MQIKSMNRYMKTLSNERLAVCFPDRQRGANAKEKSATVSLFAAEAQAEASRRRRKRERRMGKTAGVASYVKAA